VTGVVGSTVIAAVRLRRLAALLAVLAALVAVSPVCVADMPTAAMSTGSQAAAAAGPTMGEASAQVEQCPAMTAGGSATELRSCQPAPVTAGNLTGAAMLSAASDAGYPVPAATVPPIGGTAVLRYAATLHKLGLLRV
jgi:hypothetical protein